jgi:NAD(P)-dependent dehydrogenase (short-subunit alcohol dehydrogenase family)
MNAAGPPVNPMELGGRLFLVTGASSGIGREVATVFSNLNARVVLVGRDEARLNQTASLLKGSGHQTESFDLANTAAVPGWLRSVIDKAGPLDGIVHAAGIQSIIPVRWVSPEKLDLIIRTNVYSAVMLSRGFCEKRCHSGNASITFISSIATLTGRSGAAIYACSKAALIGLMKALAVELAPERIRVNCVLPGFVRSEMLAQVGQAMLPDQLKSIEKMHLLGWGAVSDAANAVAYLASDAACWVTGSAMVVDGGYTAQ